MTLPMTLPMTLGDKLAGSAEGEYVFPHLRATTVDPRDRADPAPVAGADGIDAHDRFTLRAHMQLAHGARRVPMMNIGGSATTTVRFATGV